MIDYTALRASLETYLNDNFTECPIVFENTFSEAQDGEHIDIVEQDVDSEFLGMSDDERVTRGLWIFRIFTERGIGTKRAKTIATSLATEIRGFSDEVAFDEPELNSVGEVEGTKLYQHNLVVPYTYVYGQV